jgi:cytosine/adenosine deaminase-related metal-dependent hydrolase
MAVVTFLCTMFLTADQIHDGYRFLPKDSCIEVSEEGVVLGVHEKVNNGEVQFFEGILCPGFVNVHCHLELSHLKGCFEEGKGLIPFLQHVPSLRETFSEEEKRKARHAAYDELLKNGVVAVGDIANGTDTVDVRALNQLHVQTFVECMGFVDANAAQRLEASKKVLEAFATQHSQGKFLRQNLVPHAPYSVSKTLFGLIDEAQECGLISIHNQESEEENLYYQCKQGKVKELLQGFGIDDTHFKASGENSLPTYIDWFNDKHPMIFVHNTYSSKEDIRLAKQKFKETYWCLCPNANLFLESKLPDVEMMLEEGTTLCIGTDSLASNHQLSLLAELQTLKKHFAFLDWETLLHWATVNGAKALQMNEVLGSFETGKQPGILHINNLETEQTTVTRIF